MSTDAGAPRRTPSRLLVLAAAGYGKTTLLEAETGEGACYRRAADLLDSGWVLPEPEAPGLHLLIDDVDGIPEHAQGRLLRRVTALPAPVRVSLASRRPLHPAARASLRGPWFERGPADLALTPDAVARVLRTEHGVQDAAAAAHVHEVTAGWPALVHFAGDVLARDTDELLPALTEPGTAAATWIVDQVLADLPEAVRRILETCAAFDPLCPELLDRLAGAAGLPGGPSAYAWLRRTGLLVPHPSRHPVRAPGSARLVPIVAAVLAAHSDHPAGGNDAGRGLFLAAAGWHAVAGQPLAAAKALAGAGRTDECTALIRSRADEILAAGGAAQVVELLRDRDVADRGSGLQLVLADALRMSGDAAGAERAFAPLLEAARRTARWDTGLVWRVAMVQYMRGRGAAALDLLDQAAVAEPLTEDDVMALACRTSVLSMLGADGPAAATAERCVAAAEAIGSDRAVAAAGLAAASTSTGAGMAEHLARALAAARRSGDVVQAARVLVNQAHGLLMAACYEEARDVAEQAVSAAERGSPPGVLVTALHNLGEALARLGRHEEAGLRFERSVSICRRLGLRRTAMGLWGLAQIHRDLGRREQCRTAFEEAVDLARASGEVQVLVPALVGLSRLLLDAPADLGTARACAEEARRVAPPEFASPALAALGWVALAEGDRSLGRELAAEAISTARTVRVVGALAAALELSAAVAADPADALADLREAQSIWRASGAGPAADRVSVLLGRHPGADGTMRSSARDAARRLVRSGVREVDGAPLGSPEGVAALVDIRVLGGFEVRVGGRIVPLTAWRSRQARTLVKILASRRGRYVTRPELCELIWPDDEPTRTAHRLSVILSVVRSVLDPDKAWPADRYVTADLCGLSLNVKHVGVDALNLIQDAAHAASLLRRGEREMAREILTEVDSRYRGAAFEDEPYEEWADGLREEARAAWLRSVRQLADIRGKAGEHNDAGSLLVRLLGADPYDEPAHRALVNVFVHAGRHGEARRAFDRWTAAMRSIGAPPPDPGMLLTRPAVRRDAVLTRS